MPTTYRLASMVLWALLCVCTATAQTTSTSTATPAPAELHISIGARQIKFTPLRSYQELRLEIFNNSGELLYASGAVTEAELNYDLHDSNGQPLTPGLYAYTLTVKIAETETPRQHQGHFIIEKGQDQIWLTSKDADSIGAAVTGGALTVARSPERTTAGYLASGRTLSERAGLQRDTQGRTVTDEPAEVSRRLTPSISGSGTTNRLTKWLDGPNGVVGDSVIHETAAGDLGIGTTTPGGAFDVLRNSPSPLIGRFWNTGTGPAQLRFVGGTGATSQFLITDSAEWLTSIAVNNIMGMQLRVRGVGTPNNEAELSNSARLTILRDGNVGIGTITPNTKLELNAGSANISGLRFTQLTSTSPAGSETAYLAVDAAGNVVRGTTPGGGGGGGAPAGSTGHIQFNGGGQLGADANLFWDNTSKLLGVGTSAPSGRLTVAGSNFDGAVSSSTLDVRGAIMRIGDPSIPQTIGYGTGIKFVDNGVAHASLVWNSFNSRFLLGASSNGSSLLLDGTSALAVDTWNNRIGVNIDAPAAAIHVLKTTEQLRLGYNTGTYTSFTTTDTGKLEVTPSGGQTVINGNVGIGVTNPSHKLHANGGNGTAVYGETQNGRGVNGVATNTGGWAVYGLASGNALVAGKFVGDVDVSGNLSKAGGSFRIDHPLDPANKFLSHSFVEAPEMLNIYNGNVTTDNTGLAVVTLPDYFEALNRDFRYQLTVIGVFAQAIIAEKIKGNQFKIATSQPNVEVSWLVTGVRQDAWANKHRIPTEELKPAAEQGYFLHPELYHQPEEKSLHWARDPQGLRRREELRRENAPRPATEKPPKQ